MALFNYKGLDKTGKERKGNLNADSMVNAKQKLKTLGIMIISIKEQKADAASKQKDSISFGAAVSVEELALMTRQLATWQKQRFK